LPQGERGRGESLSTKPGGKKYLCTTEGKGSLRGFGTGPSNPPHAKPGPCLEGGNNHTGLQAEEEYHFVRGGGKKGGAGNRVWPELFLGSGRRGLQGLLGALSFLLGKKCGSFFPGTFSHGPLFRGGPACLTRFRSWKKESPFPSEEGKRDQQQQREVSPLYPSSALGKSFSFQKSSGIPSLPLTASISPKRVPPLCISQKGKALLQGKKGEKGRPSCPASGPRSEGRGQGPACQGKVGEESPAR